MVDTVIEQLAASESVLTADERELGVALVDIGGGTTDLAIFERGSLWHTGVVTMGGDHFTNDIAVGLRTPIPDADMTRGSRPPTLATSIVSSSSTIEANAHPERRLVFSASGIGVRSPTAMSFVK